MSDIFLGRGDVLASTRDRGSRGTPGQISEESYRGRLRPRIPGKPIIILVDRFTASAAEIVTGALQDHIPGARARRTNLGKASSSLWSTSPLGGSSASPPGSCTRRSGAVCTEIATPAGNLLPENLDTLSAVRTPGGRMLKSGGGIFPGHGGWRRIPSDYSSAS